MVAFNVKKKNRSGRARGKVRKKRGEGSIGTESRLQQVLGTKIRENKSLPKYEPVAGKSAWEKASAAAQIEGDYHIWAVGKENSCSERVTGRGSQIEGGKK